MNVVFSLLFVTTACLVILFDFTIQRIPVPIVVLNYIFACISFNIPIIFSIIGLLIFVVAYYLDKPIDMLFIAMIGYLIIIECTIFSILEVSLLLLYACIINKPKISFMVPIELALLIELFTREVST